jgi:solute carrier family 25 citrate transporter 1
MQSLEASKNYKNSFVCAARIFKDEGILTFWSGAVPRLARLIMSGGIVFTMSVLIYLKLRIMANC